MCADQRDLTSRTSPTGWSGASLLAKTAQQAASATFVSAYNSVKRWIGSSYALIRLPDGLAKALNTYVQLNDYVYEIYKPLEGRPSVELVFLHGFQLDRSNGAYLTPWTSQDGRDLWPKWLASYLPQVRIIAVSYDAFAKRDKEGRQGNMDMHNTCENMLHSLTDDKARIGEEGCPVVLVGHSIGGLVMKQLCVHLNLRLSLQSECNEPRQNLLDSIAGLFFYATPHSGSQLLQFCKHILNGALLKDITILNTITARRNEEFRQLRQKLGWRTGVVCESLPVNLLGVQGLIVEEASARYDADDFYKAADVDHFDVCRPTSTNSSAFLRLSNFIGDVMQQWERRGETIHLDLDAVVGVRGQVNIIMQKLKGAPHLGIAGFGGMGKTTLATVVFNSISKNFDYTCFLREVKRDMPMKGSREDLQNLILRRLHHRGRKVRNDFTWERLKGKRVLIVLDDTESASQVLVMGERDGFAQESRVIVTSRDSKLLSIPQFECHYVEYLDYEDSRKLFCLHAFQKLDCPNGYEDGVTTFVEKCQGLPLALEVVGKYLYKKEERDYKEEEEVWAGVFEKSSRAMPINGDKKDELWSILTVIYESLASEEQQMFLDVATVHHDEEVRSVKRAWKALRGNSAAPTWENLLAKGLVSMTIPKKVYRDGMWTEEGDCRIKMHEVLRDLGSSIAKDTRVCYRVVNGQLPAWPFEGKSEVEILKIVSNRGLNCPRIDIDIEKLCLLERLHTLWLDGVSLYGACSSFPVNLEYLKLRKCTWSDEFDSRSPRQPGDWCSSHKEASFEEAQHRRLRHLEIEECRDLKGFLDSLGQFKALEYLTLERCSLKAFPDTFKGHPALKHLRIIDYDAGESALPKSLGELDKLEYLEILSGKLKGLPKSIGNLRKLSHVTIGGKRIETVPDALGELEELCSLQISGCDTLRGLPPTLGKLKKLRILQISGCNNLRDLPDTLGELVALEDFQILSCHNLESLPGNFGQLEALKNLKIANCKKLKSLPDSLGQLPKLRRLIIAAMDLKVFPDNLGKLKSLERLVLSDCDELKTLPKTLAQLQNVHHFIISGCGDLRELPSTIDQLKGLRQFEIVGCQSLAALPDSLGQLESLEWLSISKCNNIETLPNTLKHLVRLRQLIISRCRSLKALPSAIGSLRALEHLEVVGCQSLEGLPSTVTDLQALRSFRIDSCGGLKGLPDALGKLKALDRLEITDCHNLKYLPATFKNLNALRHLEIEWCHDLEPLRNTLAALQPLDYLAVYSRQSPEAIVDIIVQLEASKHLKICTGENKPYRVGELCSQQYCDILPCSRPDERRSIRVYL